LLISDSRPNNQVNQQSAIPIINRKMPMSGSQSHADPIRLDKIALGIVCPMANEGPAAVAFVNEVLAVCDRYGFKSVTFFAILDNVSKDDTRELLDELARRQPRLQVVWAPENRSVVDAYLRGYREALNRSCDWILEIDAGFSHQPSDIPQFFEAMAQGYDCVFATRFAHGGSISETSPLRQVVSRGGTAITNLLLGTKLTDMTSGFELFSRPVLQQVLDKGIRSRGPFFQTEIKTYCRGLRWSEVPIQYRAASHHISNASLKDAFSNLWRLFRRRVSGQL
jgi:dolichol-phosphate mannosyltransferase